MRQKRDISSELRDMLNKPYSGRLPESLEPLMRGVTRRQRNPGQFLGVNPSPQDVLRGPQPQQQQQQQQQKPQPQQQPQQQRQPSPPPQQQQQQKQQQFFSSPNSVQQSPQSQGSQSFLPRFPPFPPQQQQQQQQQSPQQRFRQQQNSIQPSFSPQQRFPSPQSFPSEFRRPARSQSGRRDEGRFIGHGTFPGKGFQRRRREGRSRSSAAGSSGSYNQHTQ